ncbi:MAG: hypothetical protein JWO30_3425 [Fibrobacteres bacterium]|nr:hypothetical protein [Fibrobacterota bacterium]
MFKSIPALILAAAAWAGAQLPVAPTLAYPADKGVNVATAVSLKWKKVATATGYEAQVASEATFAAPLMDDSTLTDTLYHVSHLADTTVYYWRARAKNAGGYGPYSKARSFTTTPPLGAGPILVSPEVSAMDVALEPTLKWNVFGDAKTYGLQISLASNFSSLLFNDTSIADTLLKVTGAGLIKGTTYYWHVRANTSPVKTAWTKGSFTTVMDAPTDAVTLGSPLDGAVDQPIPAEFLWNAVDRASGYIFQLSTGADFSTLVKTDSVQFGFATADGLTANTTYYWRVKATNSTGAAPYSAVRSFKTGSGTAAVPGPTRERSISLRAFPAAGGRGGVDVEFSLAAPAHVRIVGYSALGGAAEVLAEGKLDAGAHRASGLAGRRGAGVWFIEMRTQGSRLVRKVLIP